MTDSPNDAAVPGPVQTTDDRGVRGTRTGTLWTLVSLSVLVAVVALIFIVQNSQRTKVSFLGWHGHLPLSVLLLCATALGALLVLFAAMARIVQLRVASRRLRRASR